jgi:hypothetical protein
MRDYKGSGSFSFKKRRKLPWGLVVSALIVMTLGAAATWYLSSNSTTETTMLASAPTPNKDASGRDIIPLKIPGQQPKSADEPENDK